MALHHLAPSESVLHGVFSRDLPAVLTVDPGDTVVFTTLDSGWHVEAPTADSPGRRLQPRGSGHALCGPVHVRGAEPGMTLEVRIGRIRPGPWGQTFARTWDDALGRRLGLREDERAAVLWRLDVDRMTAENSLGHVVTLRPFMGVMGLPPAEPGEHSTIPPRPCGGNLDCRELVSGSSLFLPVKVPGALFSTGDGHGAQGDGEISGTAIECPMEECELTFVLHPDLSLEMPRAETPAGTLTFGFDPDLNEAMAVALEGMLDVLMTRHDLGRPEAMILASVVVDLRITQVANVAWGVHAVLPPGAVSGR